jgi:mRNA-degrading endonuclease toxin of MazEF toxin-antitoxin module
MAVIQRGDIRWFRFEHPDKRRPVLVLGRDELLPVWSLIPVIPLSTQIRGLAWEVELLLAEIEHAEATRPPEQRFDVGELRRALGLR